MILAIKTADASTMLWLFATAQSTDPIAELQWESGRNLSEQLLGKITEFFHKHNHKLEEVTGVCIFSGPGSFTSLRIGHSVANALADSLGVAIVGSQGEDWLQLAKDTLKSTKPGIPALPFYGSDAHITRPKS